MRSANNRKRVGFTIACLLTLSLGVDGWAGGSQAIAAPATISPGAVQARVHRLSNDADQYRFVSPSANPTADWSDWVDSGGEARASHGYSSWPRPNSVDIGSQSVIGMSPQAPTTVTEGEPFLLAKFVHYNNPVAGLGANNHSSTTIQLDLGGNTISMPADLWETPNNLDPCPEPTLDLNGSGCQDMLRFDSDVAEGEITLDGKQYRLVTKGFTEAASDGSCPAQPQGEIPKWFLTNERQITRGCFYAQLDRIHELTITKNAQLPDGSPVPNEVAATQFEFTSNSELAGSDWPDSGFSLQHGQSETHDLLATEKLMITEGMPAGDQWELKQIQCVDEQGNPVGNDADGNGATINGAQLSISNIVGMPVTPDEIECTYTNVYTPKATLTLQKRINGGPVQPADFTLTATGPDTVSGAGNSLAVTNQRVRTGTYVLSESYVPGYIQDGDWSCTNATVTGNEVAIEDGKDVVCTVTNRYSVGDLAVTKTITGETDGFVGSDATSFTGTVTCSALGQPDLTFNYDASTGASWDQSAVPAGYDCRIETETAPAQSLLANSAYSWSLPTLPGDGKPIQENQTTNLQLVNEIKAKYGYLNISKQVSPAAGTNAAYTGGNRTFPIDYVCELPAGTEVAAGTVELAHTGETGPIKVLAGAQCSFAEDTPTLAPSDFPDDSYAWLAPTLPADITIQEGGEDTAQDVTVTNTYERQFGAINLAKAVTGPGAASLDPTKTFTIAYDCGTGFTGTVDVTAGSSQQVTDLPLNTQCSFSEPTPPTGSDGLAPAFEWTSPTYSDAASVVVANPVNTGTVTNPTKAVYAKVQVAKELAGEVDGVPAGSIFEIQVSCDAPARGETTNYQGTLNVTTDTPGITPELPVGTSCEVTEQPRPDLADESYAWTAMPATQSVVAEPAGGVADVTITNTVVRQYGALSVTKQIVDPDGIFTTGTFTGTWNCPGNTPESGTWSVSGAGNATMSAGADQILYGSTCTVAEDATLPDLPNSLYSWASPQYGPDQSVEVNTATPNPSVQVTNEVVQVASNFRLQKLLGANPQGAASAASFHLSLDCVNLVDPNDRVEYEYDLAAGGQETIPPGLPAGWYCTAAETGVDDADLVDADRFYWSGITWSASPGDINDWNPTYSNNDYTVGFLSPLLPPDTTATLTATNDIGERSAALTISKEVTGETAGYDGSSYNVHVECGADGSFEIELANGDSWNGDLPVNSQCTVTESDPGRVGLVDDSYAYGEVTYSDGANTATDPITVTVARDGSTSVTINNSIERVYGELTLEKILDDPNTVVDPAREFSGTWSCGYNGTNVGQGNWTTTVGADPVVLATDIPLTSQCEVTAEDLSVAPTASDASYTWETPQLGTATMVAAGAKLEVTNTVKRNLGSLYLSKSLAGETAGYIGTGDAFTLGYRCTNPGDPASPVVTGSVQAPADGTAVLASEQIPFGWECSAYENTPGNDLLNPDGSYAWQSATITPTSATASSAQSRLDFEVTNSIKRVYADFQIEKILTGVPDTVVVPEFTGTWSCSYGADTVTGTWTAPAAGGTAVLAGAGQGGVPGRVLVASECSVTEDALALFADPSWSWKPAEISAPVKVRPGPEPAKLTVTNSAERVWSTITLAKEFTGEPHGLVAGAEVEGAWTCTYDGNPAVTADDQSFSGRWKRDARGGQATLSDDAGNPVQLPAGSRCVIVEDTLIESLHVDESYAWDPPTYSPAAASGSAAELTLIPGENQASISNSDHRVRAAFSIEKIVNAINHAVGQDADAGITYSGTYECVYTGDAATADDDETVTGDWTVSGAGVATLSQPAVLIGSQCRVVTEKTPAQPVAVDSAFVWANRDLGQPVEVLPASPDGTAGAITTVTNEFDRLVGDIGLVKRVVGVNSADLGSPNFAVEVRCVAGNGQQDINEAVTLADGQGWASTTDLGLGSTCEFSETVPAAVPGYTWLEPYWTVSNLDSSALTANGYQAAVKLPLQSKAPVVSVWNVAVQNGYTLAKTADPPSGSKVAPGDVLTYTVTVTPSDGGARNVVVSDDLSGVLANAELVPGSINASAGTASISDNKLTWEVGDIAGPGPDLSGIPGHELEQQPAPQPVTLTYQVKVSADAWNKQLRNVATASGDDPCLGDCEPSTEHAIPGYLLSKTADPIPGSSVKPGDVITYTLRVRNDSPAEITDATITDDLSKVLNAADWVGFVGASAGATRATETLTWQLASLPAGETRELSYQVKVRTSYDVQTIANQATPGHKGQCEAQGCATSHGLAELRPMPPDTGGGAAGLGGLAWLWPLPLAAALLRRPRN